MARRRGFAGLGVLPLIGLATAPKLIALGVAAFALLKARGASASPNYNEGIPGADVPQGPIDFFPKSPLFVPRGSMPSVPQQPATPRYVAPTLVPPQFAPAAPVSVAPSMQPIPIPSELPAPIAPNVLVTLPVVEPVPTKVATPTYSLTPNTSYTFTRR